MIDDAQKLSVKDKVTLHKNANIMELLLAMDMNGLINVAFVSSEDGAWSKLKERTFVLCMKSRSLTVFIYILRPDSCIWVHTPFYQENRISFKREMRPAVDGSSVAGGANCRQSGH